MSFSVSRLGAGGAPVTGTQSPGNAGAGSLLSSHADKCSSHFQSAGNSPAPTGSEAVEGVAGGSSHERQLGHEVNHMSSSTPVQGASPVLSGSLGSGSLLGSFVSSPL